MNLETRHLTQEDLPIRTVVIALSKIGANV